MRTFISVSASWCLVVLPLTTTGFRFVSPPNNSQQRATNQHNHNPNLSLPRGRFGTSPFTGWKPSVGFGRTAASPIFLVASASSEADTTDSSAVVVTRLPDSAVEIRIPVPGPATQAAYDKVCTELSKTITIPGFRKGSRIPPKVLEQAMSAKGGRNALKVQAIQELLTQLIEPALKEQSLDPIGQPTLVTPVEELAKGYVPGEALTLPVRCDVWPDIHWILSSEGKEVDERPYLGLTGTYSRKPFNQEKLDKALSDLRERYATLEPIVDSDHTLEMGDACTVNMVGYMAQQSDDGSDVKGEPLPNAASGDNVEVVLGTGRYMEGLVEGLVGAKVGETRTVSVSFPEKLRDKTLAGKRAIFDVEVVEASRRVVPEVNDDFANKVRAGLTSESLLAELRKAVDEEDAKEFTPARNKALGEALAQVMEVEVPDTLVTNQARERFAAMMADMRDNGVDDATIKQQITPENFNKYKAIVKDNIVRDFKVSMATDEIARLENINVPDYQVQEQLESIRKDAAEQKEEFDETMIRAKVETTLQRQAVYDWLAERAKLEVVYEGEETFDASLMEQLAEETIKREEEIVGAVDVTAVAAPVESAPAVETPPVALVEKEEAVATVQTAGESSDETTPDESAVSTETEEERKARYASMSVGERAFQILKDIGSV